MQIQWNFLDFLGQSGSELPWSRNEQWTLLHLFCGTIVCDNKVSPLCPSYSILKEHNILEAGSVSLLRWKCREACAELSLLEKANPVTEISSF
jgi:hypothetical protein